jgi:dTDP-4-dehydrorhamnose reductase
MRILLTGSSGQLGGYMVAEAARDELDIAAWSGTQSGMQNGIALRAVDLTRVDQVAAAFREAGPSAVVHAAALSSVADCLKDPQRARAINVEGTRLLGELCARAGVRFVYVSTDLVFDGEKGSYTETDSTAPLSVYGRTKADAERIALELPNTAVVRVSLLYGPSLISRPSFFDQQLAAIRGGDPVRLFEDEWRSPLDLKTAASALISLARSDYTGLLHIGGPERLSRFEMGQRIARCVGCDPSALVATKRSMAPFPEPRPRDCSLDSSRWRAQFPHHPWPAIEQATAGMLASI